MRYAITLAALAVGGCGAPDATNEAANEVSSANHGAAGWVISERTDQMTDVRYMAATQVARGSVVNLEITVTCDPAGRIAYAFSGQAENSESGTLLDQLGYFRADDGEAQAMQLPANRQYLNAFEVVEQPNEFVALPPGYAAQMARANRLRLRLPFLNSVEDYDIDQSASDFRSVVAPCLEKIDAAYHTAEQREREREAERERQPEEQTESYTDENSVGAM